MGIWKTTMSSLRVKLGILAAGLMLSGCMQATHYEAANANNFKPRDKELLSKVSYTRTPVATSFRRAIVDYHRKEAPGSILVDSAGPFLYYVLANGKAIRYGVDRRSSERQDWSGVATVGHMAEWPGWMPTADDKRTRARPAPEPCRQAVG